MQAVWLNNFVLWVHVDDLILNAVKIYNDNTLVIFYYETTRVPVALNTLKLNTMGTEMRIKRG